MRGTASIYNREPLRIEAGIPIFTAADAYTENYAQIASDHVEAINRGIENPFMDPELWRESEYSTRIVLRKYCAPGSRILDVGVGTGRLLAGLNDLDRYGVDIALDYLKLAKQSGIESAFARVEDLPYQPEFFDVVCCTDVLEHVFDLYRCTVETLRVLKKGGLIIARVPYKEPLHSYLSDDCPYEFVHVRNFDLDSLKLHFCKIFKCKWVEHLFTTKTYFDPDRLTVRLPNGGGELEALLRTATSKRLAVTKLASDWIEQNGGRKRKPRHRVAEMLSSTQEKFLTELHHLQAEDPDFFQALIQQISTPLEVNFVIQK